MIRNLLILFAVVLLVAVPWQMSQAGQETVIQRTLFKQGDIKGVSGENFILEGAPQDVPFEVFKNLRDELLITSSVVINSFRVGTIRSQKEWESLGWRDSVLARTGDKVDMIWEFSPIPGETKKSRREFARGQLDKFQMVFWILAEEWKFYMNKGRAPLFPSVDFEKNSIIWHADSTPNCMSNIVSMQEFKNAILIKLNGDCLYQRKGGLVVLWKTPKIDKPILIEDKLVSPPVFEQ